jgi:hypothetical protein
MSLLEALNDAWAAELITTVDNEQILLYHDHGKAEQIIINILQLQTDDGRYFYTDDICETLARAVADEGLDHKDMDFYEPDDRLRIDQIIEIIYGAEEGFDDSYECCDECGLWVYTQPTSYIDSGRFTRYPGGELMCRSCCEKDPARHLSDYLEADGEMAFIVDPAAAGLVQVNDQAFQSGLHHGMADDPKAQRKLLHRAGIDRVVMVVEPSQFYVEWEVWVDPNTCQVAQSLLCLNGQLYLGPKGQRLVLALDGDTRQASYRPDGISEWQHESWTLADEERWYDLWRRIPDEVYEFDLLTDETWKHDQAIALCRFRVYDPTVTWEPYRVALRQNPTPAQRCEAALRGARA